MRDGKPRGLGAISTPLLGRGVQIQDFIACHQKKGITMTATTHAGADRQRRMREVGFRGTSVHRLAGPDGVVIAIK
jgi:hypothetical protein